MKEASMHAKFFSSLKQVEKRLRSESPSQFPNSSSSPPPPIIASECSSANQFSSPLYLNFDEPHNSSTLQDSDPPQEFLSHSLGFPPIHENPTQQNIIKHDQIVDEATYEKDDIEQLIELLGLCELKSEEEKPQKQQNQSDDLNLKSDLSCHCVDGFYSKIAGVKGPKCVKEVDRLNGWIKYFLNEGGDEKKEPFKLVHLLLGKAAFDTEDGGDFGGFEFPSTIEEFLLNDPPTT